MANQNQNELPSPQEELVDLTFGGIVPYFREKDRYIFTHLFREETFRLLFERPEPQWLGRLIGIEDKEEAIRLFSSPEMLALADRYIKCYLKKHPSPIPAWPRSSDLVDRIFLMLESAKRGRFEECGIKIYVGHHPDDPAAYTAEYALSLYRFLTSDACKAEYPEIVDMRKYDYLRFIYLVVKLLVMVQQWVSGLYDIKTDTWHRPQFNQLALAALNIQQGEEARGRQEHAHDSDDDLLELGLDDDLPELVSTDDLLELGLDDDLPELVSTEDLPELESDDDLPELVLTEDLLKLELDDDLLELESDDDLPELVLTEDLLELELGDDLPELEKS
ncbi:hypothetical protein F4819DRAFT_273400 [Hypoxylon fuscum]|nr:hypothetical protein F4819DRAFT_273400 [Hypoxylon fuscum]